MPPSPPKKQSFPVVLDHFSLKNGPKDLVTFLYLNIDIVLYILPTFGVNLGASKWPENKIQQFPDCFGSFLLK
jgi:hypothetical protein